MTLQTRAAVLVLLLLLGRAAHSDVPGGYRAVARAEGVPADILYALACAESGRRLANGLIRPWPWALNLDGESRFYPTRVAAHQDLTRELPRRTNIDIGLGQISWRWHQARLHSPWQALDPYFNLATAARLLREEYDRCECADWWVAVERYHAPADSGAALKRRARYRERVEQCYS